METSIHIFSKRSILLIINKLKSSPIFHRLALASFWTLTGSVLVRGLNFLSSVLIARVLSVEGFGELSIIQNTVGMFHIFAAFGLGITATKFVAEHRQTDPAKAFRIIVLSEFFAMVTGGLATLLLYILANWLASNTLDAPQLANLLQVSSPLLLLGAINGTQLGALAGYEAFRKIAYISIIAGLASFPLTLLGVYTLGIEGIIWAMLLTSLITCVMSHFVVRRESGRRTLQIKITELWNEREILGTFSLPSFMSGMMMTPVTWASYAMLVNKPNGYIQMGVFNAAYIFHAMVTYFGSIFGGPLQSMVANQVHNPSRLLDKTNLLLAWLIGTIVALPLLSFPEAIQGLFGSKYAGQAFRTTFLLTIMFTLIVCYKQGLARVLVARNYMWVGTASNLFWGLILLVCAYNLTYLGSVGLAWAFLIAYSINTIVFMTIYVKLGLVPPGTLLSLDAFAIWSVVLLVAVASFVAMPLEFRVMLFLIGLLLTTFFFFKMALRQ